MKRVKNVITMLITLVMIISIVPIRGVKAATSLENIDESKYYAIQSTSTGKVVKARGIDYNPPGYVYVDGTLKNGKVDGKAAFIIYKNNDGTVAFGNVENGVNLKCENKNIPCVFNLEAGKGGDHAYNLEPVGEGYKIKTLFNKYLGIDSEGRFAKVEDDDAEIFKFEEVTVADASDAPHITLQNKSTKKYLSFKNAAHRQNAKVNVDKADLSLTEMFTYSTTSNGSHEDIVGIEGDTKGFALQDLAKDGFVLGSAYWDNGAIDKFLTLAQGPGGWESVGITGNGDGTVSIRNMRTWKLATVENGELVLSDLDEPTDKEKFIVESSIDMEFKPTVSVDEKKATEVTISWTADTKDIISGYEVWRKAPGDAVAKKIADVTETTYTDTELEKSSEYAYQVRAVNGQGANEDILTAGFSNTVNVKTLKSERPYAPKDLNIEKKSDNELELTWDGNNTSEVTYKVYQGPSAYCKDEDFKEIAADLTDTVYTIKYEDGHKYDYYKVVASNGDEDSKLSDVEAISLEKVIFGKNVYFFAPTDQTKSINKVIQDIFKVQNSQKGNAQFNENRYAFYFKKGDYKDADSVQVGFYTHIGGLGKTPYDVELNNIETGCYLDNNNATCNFWRSAENLAVTGTGDAVIDRAYADANVGSQNKLNWSVAQAAPLRRIYSTREVQYDYCYGWASGGYTADCKFTKTGETAGTYPGQQYFTRNSELAGDAYGTTLNNFLMGVISNNSTQPDSLKGTTGTTNWPMHDGDYKKDQRVITSIETTPEVAEKPFLFIDDDGEYKVFVPAMRKNTKGVSWGEGKANDGMGEGKIISIDDFYIAKEGDNASVINKALNSGKNIFFTPGIYHAETPITINKANTVVLGTGMASIIPDNSKEAMHVGDVDGVIVSGLIFDAGKSSENMLTVGSKHGGSASNPVMLQDLFFRIGGTTSSLTKAKNGIIINKDYVVTDHFWIWRADHGAGVKWGESGNLSDYGIIVNGDHVTCIALFDEHFEKNDVLWNGEYGATYFLQNEKCYDPISQDDWMSHNNTVKGYAAYKVANNVKHHYAVGLGIYNVFIYTGPTYDASKVSITLDNAIEVPNADDVTVENACIQTFANTDGAFQSFEHIINGVGEGVSSGKSNNKVGEGWSRKYLIYYNNGTAIYGKQPKADEMNKYVEDVTETGVKQLGDEVDYEDMTALIEKAEDIESDPYTAESYKALKDALKEAKKVNTKESLKYIDKETFDAKKKALEDAIKALTKKPTKEEVDKTNLNKAIKEAIKENKSDYTDTTYKALQTALDAGEKVFDDKNATQKEVDEATKKINDAIKALKPATKVDKTNLNTAIKNAYKKNKSDYTDATYKALQTALAAGEKVYDNKNATQKEVDAATKKINDAIKALKPATKVDKTKLNTAIKNGYKTDKEKYTSTSYNNLTKALAEAEKVYDSKNSTQKQVDNATKKVNDAIKALKKKEVVIIDTTYNALEAKATNTTNNSTKIGWKKYKGAQGYKIYASYCNTAEHVHTPKLIATVKGTSYNYKKLKKGQFYKIIVVAYKKSEGQDVVLATAPLIHVITKGGKYTNAKSVKTNKSSYTVKVKKSATIKPTEVRDEKSKKIKHHANVRYESTNTKVAKVNSNGKITGVKKGTCTIIAYSQNGVSKKVKVTVK